jgi:hypothetical protein
MPRTSLPETDLRRIQRFCAQMWPEQFHSEVRAETHIRGNAVTLCETRVPFGGLTEWTHDPFAQLRFRLATVDWALYWADRHSKWHEYHQGNIFCGSMSELLVEIDADPTCIFKG